MKIFEVAGVGKLHGLTVQSLDSFVQGVDPEKEVDEAAGERSKHKVAVTVSDPGHQAVAQRKELKQRMATVTADSREQAVDTAINWYKKQGYKVHDHNYVGPVSEGTLKEFAPSDSGDEEETLHKYARLWYNGDDSTQQQVEQILDRMGWEIGEVEDEEGGAFVVQSGDINGKSYIGFNVEDLTESALNENASKLLSAEDRNGVITVVVQAPDGTKKSVADANPRYVQRWLMKYDLRLPQSITSKFIESITEAPGDFGLGANYRAVPDDEMQAFLDRSKTKTKTKRDKFDYPYVHGSNIEVKDEGGKAYDSEALKKSIMVRPKSILGQNAKMQHSETGDEAIYDIGLPALKGLAVNEKTGEFVIVDTCPGAGACQTYCYAMKGSYVMFKAVSMGLARMLNFLLNDPEGFAAQLNQEIAAAKAKLAKKNAKMTVRWHDAGDFFSPEYLAMAYSVAEANPDVGFYAYTKMASAAQAERPKNFNMNFSQGALRSQEKKVDLVRTKHSKVVPKDMFFDLIARDGNNLKKDAKGRMQFASPENLEGFKDRLAQKYHIDKDSVLTYDQMMKIPVGDTPKWNVIVMPGDGDNSANRNDVIGSYLLFH